jgi:hypothetical protein
MSLVKQKPLVSVLYQDDLLFQAKPLLHYTISELVLTARKLRSFRELARKISLLTLILSFDNGSFKVIQDEGQDKTFIPEANENSIVLRYVGQNKTLSAKYLPLILLRRLQYALLDYSNYWPASYFLSSLAKLKCADRVTRAILPESKKVFHSGTHEIAEPFLPVRRIVSKVPEDWSLIGLKTIDAFKYVLEHYEFDFLFRTNTSSYVDVPLLKRHLENKASKSLYAGVIGHAFGKMEFASGAGILMSRDVVAQICRQENYWKHGLVDDVALAELVSTFESPPVPLEPLPRLDLGSLSMAIETNPQTIRENFHFRCKSKSAEETVAIMKHIHAVKQGVNQ